MRHGTDHVLLAVAVLLLAPAVSRGDVYGTANADVIVYGRMHHYAVSGGGGWYWRYDGEGGCVFKKDAYNPLTYRGDFLYHDDDDVGEPWYVYGGMGGDHIYSPSLHDGGSLVCKVWFSKVDTDTVHQYEAHIKGDDGDWNSGDGDTIYACPSWYCVVQGNGGSDDIMGGTAGESLSGQDGVDEIRGGDGIDWIYGGGGSDWLYGDEGVDHLIGEGGNDHLYGGEDGDHLHADGWGGTNFLYGEAGEDDLYGGYNTDYLYGGDNDDHLYGNYGNDRLYGGEGNDLLYGGDGTDYLYGQAGDDDDCDGGVDEDPDYCGTGSPYYCETPLVSCSTGG